MSRTLVALMFTVGLLATSSVVRAANESDLVVERGEDSETSEHVRLHAQTVRRLRAGAGPLASAIRDPRPPRSLAPRRPEPPRQSWQHPRRSEPPDEDDEALL